MAQINLEQLTKSVQELTKEFATFADIKTLFEALIAGWKELRSTLEQKMAQNKAEMQAEVDKVVPGLAQTKQDVTTAVSDLRSEMRSDSRTTMRYIDDKVNELRDLIPSEYEDTELRGKIEEVRSAIPSIPEAFDPSAILSSLENLSNEIESLKTRPASGAGGVRRVYQPYLDDFTSDTDGSTKTFYLSREPTKTDTIEVHCTDFPIILRPSTDFTVKGKTLTLSSEVAAPSAGATLLIKYYA